MENLIRIFEYVGLGGFAIWSLMERGFSLLKQHQDHGQKQSRVSFWLISFFWYAATFYAIFDVWIMRLTIFQQPLWALRILGVGLIASGLIFRFIARRDLGKQYSVHVETSEEHQLITSGIFGTIRHPAYLGLICLFVGIPLCMGSWGGAIIAAIGGVPSMIYRISVEERSLRDWFGEQFEDYQKRSWRLIPRVW